MSTERIDEIIKIVIEILQKNLDSFELYLFGSRSKGKNTLHSDIDLAVRTNSSDALMEKAKKEIEDIDTLYSIDIINIDKIDKEFKEIILSTGKKIYG